MTFQENRFLESKSRLLQESFIKFLNPVVQVETELDTENYNKNLLSVIRVIMFASPTVNSFKIFD